MGSVPHPDFLDARSPFVSVAALPLRGRLAGRLGIERVGYRRWERPPRRCSNFGASWCPIHGNCLCGRDRVTAFCLDDPECPLHGITTSHPQ